MFKVYWTSNAGLAESTDVNKLVDALKVAEDRRKRGFSFVTMVSEDPDCVGKSGVDSIKNGVCPDGIEYTWKKRRV